ncbi:MAG: neutral zinc metallopeptidase [Pseudomonadota bacterium]
MEWRGRRGSDNVTDARGRRMSGGGGGLGGAGINMLLQMVLRTFGLKGVLVLGVIGVVGWQLGLINPATLLGGAPTSQQVKYTPTAAEQELFQFVAVVLADTEDVWNSEFGRFGQAYREPELIIYRDRINTGGCGLGDSRMGPFYCPADQRIYIDLRFYDELARIFQAPGDFAQAYVIAHEVGHHIQNLLGFDKQVNAKRGTREENQWIVRLELQADFLAGVWAHHNQRYLERGDIEEAMQAANQIGDDAIQMRAQGRIDPHAFTHGTSEQRMRWFEKGLQSGRIEDGDTYSIPYNQL